MRIGDTIIPDRPGPKLGEEWTEEQWEDVEEDAEDQWILEHLVPAGAALDVDTRFQRMEFEGRPATMMEFEAISAARQLGWAAVIARNKAELLEFVSDHLEDKNVTSSSDHKGTSSSENS